MQSDFDIRRFTLPNFTHTSVNSETPTPLPPVQFIFENLGTKPMPWKHLKLRNLFLVPLLFAVNISVNFWFCIFLYHINKLNFFPPSKRPYRSGTRPVSGGYRVSFPGLKQPWREINHSPPSSAWGEEWVEVHLVFPLTSSWPGQGNVTFSFTLLYIII